MNRLMLASVVVVSMGGAALAQTVAPAATPAAAPAPPPAQGAAPAAAPSDLQSRLSAAFADPAMQKHLAEAALKSAVWEHNPCKTAKFRFEPNFIFLQKPEFDAKGAFTAGAWKFSLHEEGCGASHLLNGLAWVKAPGQLSMSDLAPGETRVDPRAQAQVGKAAFAQAAAAMAARHQTECKTTYLSNTALRAAPSKTGWSEVWTFDICTFRAAVPVKFTAGGKGMKITTAAAVLTPLK